MKYITTPLTESLLNGLKVGDKVLLNGIIYTARDAAHKKLVELIKNNKPLPFSLEGQVIYYVGPTPAPPGRPIGSAGPTTSSRLDPYTPILLSVGLKGMIGKGKRGKEVIEAIKKYKAIYFVTIGGAGALLSQCILEAKIIAYPELGPEAIYKLKVKDFPLFVANDIEGNDLYEIGRKSYQITN
ncbi:MAG TPA: Fe-S-containing hydro-lyase [Candidatus Desulfofervidus auxilii]|uniref:Fe-S-containing hydro-lyase n=1 Tax=Desulfofervidus auxilii TaxID=1621989 RepID=A0A7C0Y9C8_DESA2|nr:Fe-S-containing hydro-lyase [Candidatus Desulfofervidus auxilii]HDD43772.1 Fe-S-containing hydro-lyase [Candidatus Desulfofervidus auxilii]